MKVPTILLAVDSLAPGNGGICRVARLMARVLGEETAAGRIRAEAVALSDTSVDAGLGIPIHPCGGSRLRFVTQVQRAAWRNSQVLYDTGGMARAHGALRRIGKPFALWICGIEIWEAARPDRVFWARHASPLFSISDYTSHRAQALHPGLEHAQRCWLATEQDQPAARLTDRSEPHVLILARLDSRTKQPELCYKGHAELIACWPEVVWHVPNARLVIAGGGPGRAEWEALAKASPAAASIDFLGFVPDEKLDALFARSSVLAMPSRGEGFGLVYIEAMRHGLPVIASTHDAAPEVNLDGVTGFNVNLDHPEELSTRIVQLLQDPDLARGMGEAGQRRWVEHFRFSAFRSRFLALLNLWLRGEAAR